MDMSNQCNNVKLTGTQFYVFLTVYYTPSQEVVDQVAALKQSLQPTSVAQLVMAVVLVILPAAVQIHTR